MSRINKVILLLTLEILLGCIIVYSVYNKTNKGNLQQIIQINPESVIKSGIFYELKPNSINEEKHDWLPELVKYTHNSDGLNSLKEYTIVKPSNTYRIITLGDSFTYGLFVNTQDSYPELLQKKLNDNNFCKQLNFEVINLGVPGYDINFAIQRFLIRGIKYNPDLIVWYLKEDDFEQIYELIIEKVERIKNEMAQSKEMRNKAEARGINPEWQMASEELSKEIGIEEILKRQAKYLNSFPSQYSNKLYLLIPRGLKEEYKNLLFNFRNKRPNTFIYMIDADEFSRYPDSHFDIQGNNQMAENAYQLIAGNIQCN